MFVAITLPIYSYASYWAFGAGRLLPSKLYRRQALAVGSLAVTFWVSCCSVVVFSGSSNLQLSAGLVVVAFCLPIFAFFYLTDETIKAARRSDPLFRDILHWNKVRIPLWVVVIVSAGTVGIIAAYATLADNLTLLNDVYNGTFSNALLNFDDDYFVNFAFVGVIWLGVAALRAKWDRMLRGNFLWLAVALCLYFLFFNISFPGSFIVLFQSVGFALFMAAQSLLPVNKVQVVRSVSSAPAPIEQQTRTRG